MMMKGHLIGGQMEWTNFQGYDKPVIASRHCQSFAELFPLHNT
jgi:hypothetical protein